MTVLSTIPNNASYKDVRDTLNSVLARILALESGVTPTPTPAPTPAPSPTPPSTGPLTSFPATAAEILYELDPDALTAADQARVTSVPSASGITATAPGGLGPKMKVNAANGHAGLLFAENDAERLSLGRPAPLAAAMANHENWSAVITFKGGTSGGFNAMLGDDYQDGFYLGAGSGYVNLGGAKRNYTTTPADPAANVHTLVYSGEPIYNSAGRAFLDGTMFVGAGAHLKNGGPDLLVGCLQAFGNFFPFGGTILNIRIVSKALSAAEVLQAHFWACARYGKALPTAGRTFFPVFDGDSITHGTGSEPNDSYPAQLAVARSWPLGSFANVGKPSATVSPSSSPLNMMDIAPRDVDGFAAVTGLPVVLVSGEWFNQGFTGGTTADGVGIANYNRTYAAARKAAGKVAKHLMWTSTSAVREGAARDGFNASLVANHPNIDAVIPVHTNALIGVDGQHPNRTYFSDEAHPAPPGYAVLQSLIGAALTDAGYPG